MHPKVTAIVQFVFFAAMIIVNAMANVMPINGLNTGEVSALYPNLFVPAGFTFGIWGIIYLLLLGYTVMSGVVLWTFKQDDPAFLHVRSLFLPFILTCILNASWIFAWHYLQTVLSLIIMLLFLRTLIGIYLKLQVHRSALTGIYFFSLYVPFVVYLSWICVATIANSTAMLVNIQWNGFGMEQWIWSCAMITIAFLLTAGFAYVRGELAFALVTAWALFGIYKGQAFASETVSYTALTGSILCVVLGVDGFIKYNRKTPLEGII
jgi:translocator protein